MRCLPLLAAAMICVPLDAFAQWGTEQPLTSTNGWEVAVWGKNLGDTQYVTQATDDGLGMGYRVFNAPRTYGVSVSKRFE